MSRMLIWRRHTPKCPHRDRGREFLKCSCPLWADGYSNGKRALRVSLKTRDLSRAIKRASDLDTPGAPLLVELTAAVSAFMERCADLAASTRRKYKNSLDQLERFCATQRLNAVSDLTTETLDAFRASRQLKPITSLKELQTLRQFLGFCLDRHWIGENVAKRIKGPRNVRANDVEPFSQGEVTKIIAACDTFGRGAYERARGSCDGASTALHGSPHWRRCNARA